MFTIKFRAHLLFSSTEVANFTEALRIAVQNLRTYKQHEASIYDGNTEIVSMLIDSNTDSIIVTEGNKILNNMDFPINKMIEVLNNLSAKEYAQVKFYEGTMYKVFIPRIPDTKEAQELVDKGIITDSRIEISTKKECPIIKKIVSTFMLLKATHHNGLNYIPSIITDAVSKVPLIKFSPAESVDKEEMEVSIHCISALTELDSEYFVH